MTRTPVFARSLFILVAAAALSCVSGSKIRADAEVIRADVERARRNGAYRCAPKELATAEANLDFAEGELSEGSSFRAGEHIREARTWAQKALALSKDCAPKQVLVKEKPVEKPVIVEVQELDRDNDGIKDNEDSCPDEPEDKDEFEDTDGCPDPDNDKDTIFDTEDKCPNTPGAKETQGCPREDSDGDGIPDDIDRCRDVAEDKDGFQDEDGCPEPDNDNDGLLDAADKCPVDAGPPQNLGCPIVDKDQDGIHDDVDKCPDEPEDKDGFEDEDGCPDLDNDKDGLPDGQDKCPMEAGPAENNGCPDTDKDGDTVVDRLDKCPDEPGVAEEQGCPKKYKMVVVKKDRIEIKQQIKFRTGSHKIIGRESFEILDDVAQALKDNPQIKKIRIEGHTDSVGNDLYNLKLSQRRADQVMAELLKRGIDPGRMEAVGYGETRPIASNATKAGRAENRRTEFNIIEQ
ncbi:MAG: OmpA family protein [Myxococcaceae bacterium]|nr:OmpA family protein [Myxococcaceae bacterium]